MYLPVCLSIYLSVFLSHFNVRIPWFSQEGLLLKGSSAWQNQEFASLCYSALTGN